MTIIAALPNTLTNGTTADATQVMADLNQIVNNVNTNAADLNATNTFNASQSVTGTVTATAFSGPLTGNVTGNVTGNLTGNVTGNITGTINFGANWSAVESGGVLYFKYGGVNKAKIDSSGNMTVVGNITAYGTV